VYASRGGKATLRQLPRSDELRLLSALRDVAGRQEPPLRVVEFDGDGSSAAATAALFGGAAAVVGVHGGALANVLFCARGARVVELGSASPYARHYVHAAEALGLEHVTIPAGIGVGAAQARTLIARTRARSQDRCTHALTKCPRRAVQVELSAEAIAGAADALARGLGGGAEEVDMRDEL
jgi:hypothetical protein